MAKTGGTQEQDPGQIVAGNQFLVERLAQWGLKYARSIGVFVDYDDIVSIVHEGLFRAARSFDPSKGAPFPSYGWLRGMGHLKDALRDGDWLTRRERQLVQAWRRGDELSERRARQAARLVSQSPVVGDGPEVARNLPSGTQVEAPALDRAVVQDMLRHLPSPGREVLSRHYLDGMSLSAISVLLEVTESWVSQVHRTALRRLRCLYQAEAEAS